jgi:hypothetical protein
MKIEVGGESVILKFFAAAGRRAADAVNGWRWPEIHAFDGWRPELVILGVGAAHQVILRFFTYRIEFDHIALLASAVNFMRGGILGNLSARLTDISKVAERALTHWPPGFSMIVVAVTKLTGSTYAAVVSSDLLAIAQFHLACAFLLVRLSDAVPRSGRILAATVIGFTGPSYLENFTNPWTLGMFLWATYLLLPKPDGTEPSPKACLAAGLLLALTVSLRFAYGPASLAPVIFTAARFWRQPGGRERIAALAGGYMIGIAPILYWKSIYTGGARLYGLRFGGHFYPKSLLRFHPFGSDVIFAHGLNQMFPYSHYKFKDHVITAQFALRHAVSFAVLASAVVGAREAFFRAPSPDSRKIFSRFVGIGALTVAVDVLFLVTLALIHAPDKQLRGWVYVEEPRYFAVCLPFILIAAACVAGAAVTFPQRALQSFMMTAVVAGALFFVVSLPSRWERTQIGGPVERYFLDQGEFVRFLRAAAFPDKPTVFVEFGSPSNKTYLRYQYATFVGLPTALVEPGRYFSTSKEIGAIFVVSGSTEGEALETFELACRQNRGTRIDVKGFKACRAVLRPRRARQTDAARDE